MYHNYNDNHNENQSSYSLWLSVSAINFKLSH